MIGYARDHNGGEIMPKALEKIILRRLKLQIKPCPERHRAFGSGHPTTTQPVITYIIIDGITNNLNSGEKTAAVLTLKKRLAWPSKGRLHKLHTPQVHYSVTAAKFIKSFLAKSHFSHKNHKKLIF